MDEWTIFFLLYWAFATWLFCHYERRRQQHEYEQRRLEYSRRRLNSIRNLTE